MANQANKEGLLTAYRVPGFRARALIDRYEDKHPAFVITLDRRQKKQYAADAGQCITVFTTGVGTGHVILIAAATPFIWILSIAGWRAKGAAA